MSNVTEVFKESVHRVVKRIPRGSVMTYKEVAEESGHPGAWRAVGSLLKLNYDKSIPCHRVIRSDGHAGEYNRGTAKKVAILKSEGAIVLE